VRNHKPAVGGSNPTVVAFFAKRAGMVALAHLASLALLALLLAPILRLTLCLAVIFYFYVTLLSPISCILPPCRNPAARNNFFSSHLIYLRTIHYFIHLNSSNTFVILLPSSYLALAFCPRFSLLCCNHATRNNFYSNRLIHFRTIHSLYPHQEPPRGLPGLVNAIGSLPTQCRR
jgi:hypothetical protein